MAAVSPFGGTNIAELRRQVLELEQAVDRLDTKLGQQKRTLQTQIRLLTAAISMMEQAIGTGDFNKAIRTVQRLIHLIIMIRTQITMLNAALATTPAGWLLNIIGIIGTAASGWGIITDIVEGY